ncbi:Antagonist of MEN (Mitotic Exit Network) [Saitoella coloradoensis]
MSAIFEHIDRSTPMKSNASQRKRRHSQMSKESGRDNEETDDVSGTLHNCMRVCKTWYPLARDVAEKRVSMSYAEDQRMSSWIDGPAKAGRARELVLHQCNIKQGILADIPEQPYLRSLEMYCCTSAIPPKSLLQSNLRSLSLPGCSLVSDQLLEYITQQCRGLVHLDLRACDLVSDRGLKAIAHYCRDLRYLNVGRVNKCENITSSGVSAIARRCVALETIGLAGTAVCDYGLIALARGPSAQTLQRLSVNECAYLTDHCVTILPDLPSLILFEIRGCHIQKASELVRWRNGVSGMGRSKRWVEAGEALNHAMHRFEHYAKYWMEMAQQVKDLSAPQTLVPRRRKRRQSLRGGSFDGRLR